MHAPRCLVGKPRGPPTRVLQRPTLTGLHAGRGTCAGTCAGRGRRRPRRTPPAWNPFPTPQPITLPQPCRPSACPAAHRRPPRGRLAGPRLVPGAVFGAGEGRPPSDRRVLVRGRARSWRTVSVAQRGSGGRCRRGCRRLVDEEARKPSTCGTQTQSVSAGARMGQVRAGRGGASPSSPPNSSLVVVGRLGGQETSVSMVRPMLRRRPGTPLGGASRYR